MEIKIGYETAMKRHPKEMELIKEQIKQSKSKFKDVPLSEYTIGYNSCTVHKSGSYNGKEFFEKMSSGELQKEVNEYDNWINTATIDEKIAKRVSQTHVSLYVKYKRGSGFVVPLTTIPYEIMDEIRKYEIHEQSEIDRVKSITNEDRENESIDLIRELGMDSGFLHVKYYNPGSDEPGL